MSRRSAAASTPIQPPASRPEAKSTPPAWAGALEETTEKVGTLVQEQRFGEAIAEYDALVRHYNDARLRKAVSEGTDNVRRQARAAYRTLERRARDLASRKKFTQARGAVRAAIRRYGVPAGDERITELLMELETAAARHRAAVAKAEARAAQTTAVAAKAEAKAAQARAEAARRTEEEKGRRAEARFAEARQRIDATIKAWNYREADGALAELKFDQPHPADRIATRRAEVALLAKLKAKMIAKINQARPPFRKSTFRIPGFNGDLVKADEEGITAALPDGKIERHPWKSISRKSARLLAQRLMDRHIPDDRVAAALLALVYGDLAAAQKDFEAARAIGARVERHLGPIAEAAFAKIGPLIDKGRFAEAEAALTVIESKFGKTPWFAHNKQEVAAARRRAKSEAAEAAAEKLYKQAAALYSRKDYFELKPLVEELNAELADTRAVTDAEREPTVAEMAKATADLGKILTVRRDGKGDFKTIQAAIDAAPPKSAVIITDSGVYHESPRIPEKKQGLTLRGTMGRWPMITSKKFDLRECPYLVDVSAAGVTIERLVLNHSTYRNIGGSFGIVHVKKGASPIRVRSCVLYMAYHGGNPITGIKTTLEMDHCVLAFRSSSSLDGTAVVTNSIWLNRQLSASSSESKIKFENVVMPMFSTHSASCEFRSCTIAGRVRLNAGAHLFVDCIVERIEAQKRNVNIDYCNVHGDPAYVEFAKPGKGCLSADPLFRKPERFDYRLKTGSPCRKRASGGGDIGCRYTPEMLAVLKKALELWDKGIIKF